MKFINRNKYHLAGISLVILLFVVSVSVRKENLSVPLSRHHEWITAHTLITCEIWDQNGGPGAYHFSPVYTYPGEGNQKRRMLGGITDEKGDVYYVSYPPFAFLFAYYVTHLFGEPDTDSIRAVSLAIHLLCAIFIYLIATTLLPEVKKNYFSMSGLTGAFLYLFSTGNLWIHANLYFSDMLLQLFMISGIYFTILLVRERFKNTKLILAIIFILFFLATYTEWLGLFLSFFTGLIFLMIWFIKREPKFLAGFITIGLASLLALSLTLMQYSSIAGWDKFKEVSTSKYQERSGHESEENSPAQFNLENDEAYDFMIGRIDRNYLMAENFAGIFGIGLLIILLIPNARRRIENAGISVLMLVIISLAILLHYYLFFNFNSLHDFSSLKTGFLIILLCVVCISMIESVLSNKINLAVFVLISFLCVQKGLQSIDRYIEDYPLAEVDWNRISTGEVIRKYAKPEQAVFVNITSNPELVYCAGHNIFPLKDTSELLLFMNHFDNDFGQYYHHRGQELEYIQEFERKGNRLIFTKRMNISAVGSGEGKTYQK